MRKAGFTLIELLVVIAIIALLSSVVLASLNAARSKGRFARIMQDLHQVEVASQGYFADNGAHAPDVGTGVAPAFVPSYIKTWPTPPCAAGWTYDWENWLGTTGFVGVSLRNTGGTQMYYYCTDRSSNCPGGGGGGTDMNAVPGRQISC